MERPHLRGVEDEASEHGVGRQGCVHLGQGGPRPSRLDRLVGGGVDGDVGDRELGGQARFPGATVGRHLAHVAGLHLDQAERSEPAGDEGRDAVRGPARVERTQLGGQSARGRGLLGQQPERPGHPENPLEQAFGEGRRRVVGEQLLSVGRRPPQAAVSLQEAEPADVVEDHPRGARGEGRHLLEEGGHYVVGRRPAAGGAHHRPEGLDVVADRRDPEPLLGGRPDRQRLGDLLVFGGVLARQRRLLALGDDVVVDVQPPAEHRPVHVLVDVRLDAEQVPEAGPHPHRPLVGLDPGLAQDQAGHIALRLPVEQRTQLVGQQGREGAPQLGLGPLAAVAGVHQVEDPIVGGLDRAAALAGIVGPATGAQLDEGPDDLGVGVGAGGGDRLPGSQGGDAPGAPQALLAGCGGELLVGQVAHLAQVAVEPLRPGLLGAKARVQGLDAGRRQVGGHGVTVR